MPRKFLLSLAALLLLSGGLLSYHPRAENPYRDRLGIYLWGQMPSLEAAAVDSERLGADRVTRIYIGPWWDPKPYFRQGEVDCRPLNEKMYRPDYQKVLAEFQVIMITAYDLNECPDGYRKVLSLDPKEAESFLAAVKQEFQRFAFELSKMDRTFILSNWEAENDATDVSLWPRYATYLQARIDGILAGRTEARQAGYPGRVFAAFEFTRVPGFQGLPSGLVEIGKQLHGLDYLSYSSWHSIGWDYDADTMKVSFEWGIRAIREWAFQNGLPEKLIIGEFGEYWNFHPDGDRLKSIIDIAIQKQVDYLFSWTLYDQPGEKDEWGRDASHFGKYFLNRTLTPQGRAYYRWLNNFVPASPEMLAYP